MPADGPAVATELPRRSWGEALGAYLDRRAIAMLFLGFSAGLPFLLIFATLSAWLREAEVSRSAIGLFSWVGLTFSLKVFWAPVVDRTPLPLLDGLLGRRRSWMLLAQIGIALGLVGIAFADPAADLGRIALLCLTVAFASATQDIAIDAFRIESAPDDLQGTLAATYQFGYRIALIVAGAGALYIAEFVSWPAAYLAMAAAVGVGMATVLLVPEPPYRGSARETFRSAETGAARLWTWFKEAAVAPFVDFFARNGHFALVILALIACYRLSDIVMGIMANPFYIDLGFSKAEIASVSKLYGVLMTMLGAFLGGLLVARFGLLKPLVLGACLVASTNLIFAYLASVGPDINLLALTISADNLSAGLAGSALIAYLSSLTSQAYTATQYALFSSLFTLPGKLVGGTSGFVVDAVGYVSFFLYAATLGLPAIFLAILVWRLAKVTGAKADGAKGQEAREQEKVR